MRIGFVTCVRLGLSCMEAIYQAGGRLDFAMTLRDDLAPGKSGRVRLDDFCAAQALPLHKIANINDAEAIAAVRRADLDWLFVVGWSQLAKADVLTATRRGVLGMHPTLLPVGRGRAPIPWAILLGLPQTGVTLFQMDLGVDSGPIIAQTPITLAPRETATTLYAKVAAAHATLLRDQWHALVSDRLQPRTQDESRATVWPARKPEDGQLLAQMPVADAERLVRAVTHPYPGAFMWTPEGRLTVWSSGAPLEDLGGAGQVDTVRRLQFSDGWIDATGWTLDTDTAVNDS
jgi:methionyl-tRNA formyltransferase